MAQAGEHQAVDAPAPERAAPASAAPGPALGNRAVGALLGAGPGARGAVVHPKLGPLLARRRLLQRRTREEMIAGLEKALADAPTTAGGWKEVALWLNGFDAADIRRMTSTRMTVDQLRETRAAIERDLSGWPMQTILNALDDAAVAKGSHLRPQSSTIWAAYSNVSYAKWHGQADKNKVWELVGGSVGKGFEGENTCATRVSYAFNYGGWPIRDSKSGWIYPNDPKVDYKGTKGDGRRYIVSAPFMKEFLTGKWGPPDVKFATGAAGNAEAKAFEGTLRPDQVAVFAGPHHAGLIKQGYADAYVFTDPGVMPAVAWTLP
jgi:Type VI secretion system (T6SS), amidase effector protein 4